MKIPYKFLWRLLGIGMLLFTLLIVLVRYGLFGPLPDFKELENPKTNLATQILSHGNQLLGTYFKENRTNCDYSEISPYVIDALVSTEDERYYSHPGIDLRGLTRALVFMGSKGGASTISQQLAKLLFTQPARSFIHRVTQKLKEWIIAVQLERHYTKEEIITMYLNKFDWVNHAVGIKSASNIYFSKEAKDLNVKESAMLVGMLKNPSLFNPIKRDSITCKRRNTVLNQMVKNNKLQKAVMDTLKLSDLDLVFTSVDHKEGSATYFREVLRAEVSSIFKKKEEGSFKYRKADGTAYNIYKDGLKIYTTIDSRMQKHAEWAVTQHLKYELQPDLFKDLSKKKNAPFDWRVTKKQIDQILTSAIKKSSRYRVLVGKECSNCGRGYKYVSLETNKAGQEVYQCSAEDCGASTPKVSKAKIDEIFNTPVPMEVFSWNGPIDTTLSPLDSIRYYKSFLHAGFMAMNPHSGHIKAWVGGIDYKNFNYDHVRQGKRQVGSTFKPFIYSFAMQNGYTPCTKFPNVTTCFDIPDQPSWCPKNSDNSDQGKEVTLKYALANSMNTITAKLMKQFTPGAIVDYTRKLGITSSLDPVPSLCLGVADLSVYEMVGANATFANGGIYTEPIFIDRIEDKNGNIIYQKHPKKVQAMDASTAYTTIELMKGVTSGGSGQRLRGRRAYANIPWSIPIAGKTGTTNNHSDGWFIGITPELVSGCWVGADDRAVHFASIRKGQGANMALPIWGYFMNKVYKDPSIKISKGDFKRPPGITQSFDCSEIKEAEIEGDLNNFEE